MTIEWLYYIQQFTRTMVLMLMALGLGQLLRFSRNGFNGSAFNGYGGYHHTDLQPKFVELVCSICGFRLQIRTSRSAASFPQRLSSRQHRLEPGPTAAASPIFADPRPAGSKASTEPAVPLSKFRAMAVPRQAYPKISGNWPRPADLRGATAGRPFFRPEDTVSATTSADHPSPARKLLKFNGLDIAARSVACDDTGGDFYYLRPETRARNSVVRVAVGDAADHGRKSTALMLTTQSTLHERSSRGGDLAAIVSDVNDRLTSKSRDDGEFITLYFMDVDPDNRRLNWVRAGHDPAALYDPETDSFQSLKGSGIPLGVEADWHYKENFKTDITPGQIITIATDGIWEAHNRQGRMLGKQEIRNCIRAHATLPAEEILDAVFARLGRFRRGATVEDDATLVVIKVVE